MADEPQDGEVQLLDDLTPEQVEAAQEPPQEPENEIDQELVDQARKYGWKPKDEFDLAPEGWVDADRFLDLHSTRAKIERDRRREVEAMLKERDKAVERAAEMARVGLEKQYERDKRDYEARIAQLEAEKREAAEVGDLTKYDDLDRQRREVKPPEEIKELEAPEQEAGPHPEVKGYLDEQAWTKDPDAFDYARKLIAMTPGAMALPPMKQIKWAEERVKEHFPEHFASAPAQQTTSKVDPGGIGGRRKQGSGFDRLSSEDQRAARELIQQGIFKDEAEYMRTYREQYG